MSFVETSSAGWLGRIGGSLKGMLFGLLLLPVGVIVIFLNERNAVRDIRANEELGAGVISVSSERVDPANEGRLVHLSGRALTQEVLRNEEFGVEEPAIRIAWNARIYQWKESSERRTRKTFGGGEETVTTYQYEKVWSDKVIDSSRFKEPGHDNAREKAFRSGSIQADGVTVGAYSLPAGLVSKIESSQPLPIGRVPAPLAEKGKVIDGVFYTGLPKSPAIGDEKVEFSITRPVDVTVMAVQAGDSFRPYVAKNGKEKFLLYGGLLAAGEVVQGEERKAALLRWGLRGGGLLLMFLGFVLLLRPLSVLADVVPVFGSLVGFATGSFALLLSGAVSLTLIALAWVAFRPLIGIPLLVVAAGCVVAVVVMAAKGRSRTLAAAGGSAR
jgi:hypothetical protein